MKLEKDIKFLEEEKVIKIIFLFKSFLYYFIFFINILFFLGQDVVRRRTGIFFNSITE